MAVSDVLKSFRTTDDKPKEEGQSSRVLKLSEEEQKELGSYQKSPGEELTCQITGKLEGDHFHVMSVSLPGSDGGISDEDMAKVAGAEPPMMRNQVTPSPS